MAKKIKVSGTTTLTITRDGKDATIYAIRLSAGSVNLSSISADGKTGTPSPASVTVTVSRQTGDAAPVTLTALSPGWQLQFRMVTRAGGDSGWAAVVPGASVPSSTSTACASYQYRLIDGEKNVRAEASCTYVQDGLNGGTNGENAVGAVVTPASVVFVRSSSAQSSPVYIDLYDGQTRVPFNGTATAGDGTFGCSVMVGGGVAGTDGLSYSGAKSGDRLAVTFSLAAGRAVSKTVTVNLRYKTSTIPVTIGIETVENGADGRDAPQLVISPQAVTFKKSDGSPQTQRVYIDLYDNGERVPYQDKDKGNFLCHALASVGEDVTEGLGWGYSMDSDKRFYYNLKLHKGRTVCFNVPFTYQYRGVTYSAIIPVNTVTDGIRGGRGPALRLMLWSSCNTGFPFEDGSEGCTYLDCVIYEDAYYLCNTSHAKAADNNPGSNKDTNGNLWKGANKFDIVATKLLLAQYALIDNLGVKHVEVQGDDGEIVMTDKEGKVRFRVKDGQIMCKTGTFEGVTVSGFMYKTRTVVTQENFDSFFVRKTDGFEDTVYLYDIDFSKCGTWLDIRYLPDNAVFYPKSLRRLVGNTILIYNNSGKIFSVSASCNVSGYGRPPTGFVTQPIPSGYFASLECKVGSLNGKEVAYFDVQTGLTDTSLDN